MIGSCRVVSQKFFGRVVSMAPISTPLHGDDFRIDRVNVALMRSAGIPVVVPDVHPGMEGYLVKRLLILSLSK